MIFLKGAFSNKFYRKKRRGFFKDFFGRLRRAEKSSAKQERNCGGRKRKVRTAVMVSVSAVRGGRSYARLRRAALIRHDVSHL